MGYNPEDYEIVSNGKGGYDIRKKSYIGETIGGIVVLVIILFICMQCSDSSSPKSGQGTEEGYANVSTGALDTSSNDVSVIPGRMVLTDLYVFDKSDWVNSYSDDTQNAYGTIFHGPYLQLQAGYNHDKELDLYVGYIEYVAGRNYQTLTGTYFAIQDQPQDFTSQLLIYADGILIYASEQIGRDIESIDFTVDIGYCNVLRLEIRANDCLQGSFYSSQPGVIIVNAEVYN